MGKILDNVETPDDIKGLSFNELDTLAQEIRDEIKSVVSKTGGHLASNLGAVELTLALHRQFDFNVDRLVFDVGHQCYTHKIITGRKGEFSTIRQKNGLSGYPNTGESEYDAFNSGHAGTAMSAAIGMVCGDELKKTEREIVVLIGDGSIPSGLSLEALNQIGHLGKKLIIVLNDNEMSISPTVGAISKHLTNIRTGSFYNKNVKRVQRILKKFPLGSRVNELTDNIAGGIMGVISPGQFFQELGIRYFGPIDGHSIEELEKVLRNCRDMDEPLLIHAVTKKGHGYYPATNDPETYHGAKPFNIKDGSAVKQSKGKSYSQVFSEKLTSLAEDNERIVAITAAMPLGTGLNVFQEKHPDRIFDVGICEQHAVTFASGLSESGHKPVVAIYSTFLQRSFDQIFHDITMQKDMDVLFAIDRAGLVGSDGYSHHGVMDISMLRPMQGMVLMAPKDGFELEMMIEYCIKQKGLFAVRYPRETSPGKICDDEYPEIEQGKAEVLTQGKDVVIFAYGAAVTRACDACEQIKKDITVVNARFAKPIDTDMLLELSEGHKALVTVEDHMLSGGFGSAVLEACFSAGIDFDRILRLGIPDRYIEHAARSEQLEETGLDAEGIAGSVNNLLEEI